MAYPSYEPEVSDVEYPAVRWVSDGAAWLRRPVVILGVVFPVLILTFSRAENMLGALVAYVNLLAVGFFCAWAIKHHWLPGAVPLIALAYMALSHFIAPLFFAVFSPDRGYHTLAASYVPYTKHLLRCQLASTTLLVPYMAIVGLAIASTRRKPTAPAPINRPTMLAMFCIWFTFTGLGLKIVSIVFSASGTLKYITDVVHQYTQGLLLAVGAIVTALPKKLVLLLMMCLGVIAIFLMIGNARGYALFPILLMGVGYFVFNRSRTWRKIRLLLMISLLLPIILVIGNVTRSTLGGGGFENIGQRWDILTGKGIDWLMESDFVGQTFGRFHANGMHGVVSQSPERVPFHEFSPIAYAGEMLRFAIPGSESVKARYATHFQLRRYGFRVTEKTSTGVTQVGHFWMQGGFFAVFCGGIAIGLLHAMVVLILQSVSEKSSACALIMLGMLSHRLFKSFMLGLIILFKYVVALTIMGMMFAVLFHLIGGNSPPPYDEYEYFDQDALASGGMLHQG